MSRRKMAEKRRVSTRLTTVTPMKRARASFAALQSTPEQELEPQTPSLNTLGRHSSDRGNISFVEAHDETLITGPHSTTGRFVDFSP